MENMIRISPNLTTSGQPSLTQLSSFHEDYDVVINLTDYNKLYYEESDILSKYGVEYIHIPVTWQSPETHKLDKFFERMRPIYNKKRVLVHCVKNYRASVFVYRYLKDVERENVSFMAPANYRPDDNWREFIGE